MKARCTRGFGKIEDPQDGTVYNVERDTVIEVSDAVFKRLDETYPGMEAVTDAEPGGAEAETTEEHSAETETFACGVEKANGDPCSREVESETATCWQH